MSFGSRNASSIHRQGLDTDKEWEILRPSFLRRGNKKIADSIDKPDKVEEVQSNIGATDYGDAQLNSQMRERQRRMLSAQRTPLISPGAAMLASPLAGLAHAATPSPSSSYYGAPMSVGAGNVSYIVAPPSPSTTRPNDSKPSRSRKPPVPTRKVGPLSPTLASPTAATQATAANAASAHSIRSQSTPGQENVISRPFPALSLQIATEEIRMNRKLAAQDVAYRASQQLLSNGQSLDSVDGVANGNGIAEELMNVQVGSGNVTSASGKEKVDDMKIPETVRLGNVNIPVVVVTDTPPRKDYKKNPNSGNSRNHQSQAQATASKKSGHTAGGSGAGTSAADVKLAVHRRHAVPASVSLDGLSANGNRVEFLVPIDPHGVLRTDAGHTTLSQMDAVDTVDGDAGAKPHQADDPRDRTIPLVPLEDPRLTRTPVDKKLSSGPARSDTVDKVNTAPVKDPLKDMPGIPAELKGLKNIPTARLYRDAERQFALDAIYEKEQSQSRNSGPEKSERSTCSRPGTALSGRPSSARPLSGSRNPEGYSHLFPHDHAIPTNIMSGDTTVVDNMNISSDQIPIVWLSDKKGVSTDNMVMFHKTRINDAPPDPITRKFQESFGPEKWKYGKNPKQDPLPSMESSLRNNVIAQFRQASRPSSAVYPNIPSAAITDNGQISPSHALSYGQAFSSSPFGKGKHKKTDSLKTSGKVAPQGSVSGKNLNSGLDFVVSGEKLEAVGNVFSDHPLQVGIAQSRAVADHITTRKMEQMGFPIPSHMENPDFEIDPDSVTSADASALDVGGQSRIASPMPNVDAPVDAQPEGPGGEGGEDSAGILVFTTPEKAARDRIFSGKESLKWGDALTHSQSTDAGGSPLDSTKSDSNRGNRSPSPNARLSALHTTNSLTKNMRSPLTAREKEFPEQLSRMQDREAASRQLAVNIDPFDPMSSNDMFVNPVDSRNAAVIDVPSGVHDGVVNVRGDQVVFVENVVNNGATINEPHMSSTERAQALLLRLDRADMQQTQLDTTKAEQAKETEKLDLEESQVQGSRLLTSVQRTMTQNMRPTDPTTHITATNTHNEPHTASFQAVSLHHSVQRTVDRAGAAHTQALTPNAASHAPAGFPAISVSVDSPHDDHSDSSADDHIIDAKAAVLSTVESGPDAKPQSIEFKKNDTVPETVSEAEMKRIVDSLGHKYLSKPSSLSVSDTAMGIISPNDNLNKLLANHMPITPGDVDQWRSTPRGNVFNSRFFNFDEISKKIGILTQDPGISANSGGPHLHFSPSDVSAMVNQLTSIRAIDSGRAQRSNATSGHVNVMNLVNKSVRDSKLKNEGLIGDALLVPDDAGASNDMIDLHIDLELEDDNFDEESARPARPADPDHDNDFIEEEDAENEICGGGDGDGDADDTPRNAPVSLPLRTRPQSAIPLMSPVIVKTTSISAKTTLKPRSPLVDDLSVSESTNVASERRNAENVVADDDNRDDFNGDIVINNGYAQLAHRKAADRMRLRPHTAEPRRQGKPPSGINDYSGKEDVHARDLISDLDSQTSSPSKYSPSKEDAVKKPSQTRVRPRTAVSDIARDHSSYSVVEERRKREQQETGFGIAWRARHRPQSAVLSVASRDSALSVDSHVRPSSASVHGDSERIPGESADIVPTLAQTSSTNPESVAQAPNGPADVRDMLSTDISDMPIPAESIPFNGLLDRAAPSTPVVTRLRPARYGYRPLPPPGVTANAQMQPQIEDALSGAGIQPLSSTDGKNPGKRLVPHRLRPESAPVYNANAAKTAPRNPSSTHPTDAIQQSGGVAQHPSSSPQRQSTAAQRPSVPTQRPFTATQRTNPVLRPVTTSKRPSTAIHRDEASLTSLATAASTTSTATLASVTGSLLSSANSTQRDLSGVPRMGPNRERLSSATKRTSDTCQQETPTALLSSEGPLFVPSTWRQVHSPEHTREPERVPSRKTKNSELEDHSKPAAIETADAGHVYLQRQRENTTITRLLLDPCQNMAQHHDALSAEGSGGNQPDAYDMNDPSLPLVLARGRKTDDMMISSPVFAEDDKDTLIANNSAKEHSASTSHEPKIDIDKYQQMILQSHALMKNYMPNPALISSVLSHNLTHTSTRKSNASQNKRLKSRNGGAEHVDRASASDFASAATSQRLLWTALCALDARLNAHAPQDINARALQDVKSPKTRTLSGEPPDISHSISRPTQQITTSTATHRPHGALQLPSRPATHVPSDVPTRFATNAAPAQQRRVVRPQSAFSRVAGGLDLPLNTAYGDSDPNTTATIEATASPSSDVSVNPPLTPAAVLRSSNSQSSHPQASRPHHRPAFPMPMLLCSAQLAQCAATAMARGMARGLHRRPPAVATYSTEDTHIGDVDGMVFHADGSHSSANGGCHQGEYGKAEIVIRELPFVHADDTGVQLPKPRVLRKPKRKTHISRVRFGDHDIVTSSDGTGKNHSGAHKKHVSKSHYTPYFSEQFNPYRHMRETTRSGSDAPEKSSGNMSLDHSRHLVQGQMTVSETILRNGSSQSESFPNISTMYDDHLIDEKLGIPPSHSVVLDARTTTNALMSSEAPESCIEPVVAVTESTLVVPGHQRGDMPIDSSSIVEAPKIESIVGRYLTQPPRPLSPPTQNLSTFLKRLARAQKKGFLESFPPENPVVVDSRSSNVSRNSSTRIDDVDSHISTPSVNPVASTYGYREKPPVFEQLFASPNSASNNPADSNARGNDDYDSEDAVNSAVNNQPTLSDSVDEVYGTTQVTPARAYADRLLSHLMGDVEVEVREKQALFERVRGRDEKRAQEKRNRGKNTSDYSGDPNFSFSVLSPLSFPHSSKLPTERFIPPPQSLSSPPVPPMSSLSITFGDKSSTGYAPPSPISEGSFSNASLSSKHTLAAEHPTDYDSIRQPHYPIVHTPVPDLDTLLQRADAVPGVGDGKLSAATEKSLRRVAAYVSKMENHVNRSNMSRIDYRQQIKKHESQYDRKFHHWERQPTSQIPDAKSGPATLPKKSVERAHHPESAATTSDAANVFLSPNAYENYYLEPQPRNKKTLYSGTAPPARSTTTANDTNPKPSQNKDGAVWGGEELSWQRLRARALADVDAELQEEIQVVAERR